jgi:glycosyltransferase involved in cell wall biosynthesis
MLTIPTLNERENIEAPVVRVRASAESERILSVDDGSPDSTAEELARLQKHDAGIQLLRRQGRRGYASSCRDGMNSVKRERFPTMSFRRMRISRTRPKRCLL